MRSVPSAISVLFRFSRYNRIQQDTATLAKNSFVVRAYSSPIFEIYTSGRRYYAKYFEYKFASIFIKTKLLYFVDTLIALGTDLNSAYYTGLYDL